MIVVGMNVSGPSRAALDWAMVRAERLGDSVRATYVLEDEALWEAAQTVLGRAIDPLATIDEEIADARARHPSVSVEPQLVAGDVVDGLVEASAAATLLVTGTHKSGFVHGRVFGSRGLLLAVQANTPLAVVPVSWQGSTGSGVTLGVGDHSLTDGVLDFGRMEAARLGRGLTLIRAWMPPAWSGADQHLARAVEEKLSAGAREIARSAVAVVSGRCASPGTRGRTIRRPTAEALIDASAGAAELVLGAPDSVRDMGIVHDVLMNLARPTILVPRSRHTSGGHVSQ
jgi:nucleotide-binding universal stress UspA family protein